MLDMLSNRYEDIFEIIRSLIYEAAMPIEKVSPTWGRLEGR